MFFFLYYKLHLICVSMLCPAATTNYCKQYLKSKLIRLVKLNSNHRSAIYTLIEKIKHQM